MSKTHVYFVLDETGSMMPYLDKTISGFNEYLDGLKKDGNLRLSLTLFNSVKIDHRFNDAKIVDVPSLNRETYKPDRLTPLYDAIGETIKKAESERGKKAKVLFVILTDGMENASKEYTQHQIFDLISEKRKHGWEFVYLGANQDAWAVGGLMGVDSSNTSSFDQSKTIETFNVAVSASRGFSKGSRTGLVSDEDSAKIQDNTYRPVK